MTALAGVELESLVSEPDALTTRPPQMFEVFHESYAMFSRSRWFDKRVVQNCSRFFTEALY